MMVQEFSMTDSEIDQKTLNEKKLTDDEESFYIAFEDCDSNEIEPFVQFLETNKLIKLHFDKIAHNINGKCVKFAKIEFPDDFIKHSEYVDRLKFQLRVKDEQKIRSNSKSNLIDIDHDKRPNDEIINLCNGDSVEIGCKRKQTLWEWIKKSLKEDDVLDRYLEIFELRRNNTDNFNKEDLESYLIRGTILQSILYDSTDYEIEYFLVDLENKIKTCIQKEVYENLENENYKFLRSYSKGIIPIIDPSTSISEKREMLELHLRNVINPEISKYANYNSVRSKIVIFPLHKKLRPLEKWISLKNCLGRQPLDDIKNYFGVKVATYFAWAGFYTSMLIIASVVGLVCFALGLLVIPYSKLSADICKSSVIMCPRCDKWCDYWKLKDTCTQSMLHHAIDNSATILYTIFMSIWSALYLRQWLRYIAKYNTAWDVINLDFSSLYSRKEYIKNVRELMHSNDSNSSEFYIDEGPKVPKTNKAYRINSDGYPKIPKKIKAYRITLSFLICILWVSLAIGMVFGIILYRMALLTSERLYGDKDSFSIYFVPVSTALMDLIGIQGLNYVYDIIAVHLTKLELHRTEIEYENSLSIKLFLFQFVNYYSAIFYIAILKGKFVGSPAAYTRFFGYRQEECNPGGCLVELAIQLGIIMTGRQAIKMATPYVIAYCEKLKKIYDKRKTLNLENKNKKPVVYVKNYHLKKFGANTLMPEYLEMVIQFGFVTLFVAAFPLAPLFALLNNILEVRLDGRKFLREFRRPMPSRVEGIGVWLNIMGVMTRIAAASNAIIIAFSSHFIPKLVYRINYSTSHSFAGYLNYSLATFNVKDMEERSKPSFSEYKNISTCYYQQYRSSPDDTGGAYKKHLVYWHVMAARLAFIVVYQFFITLIVIVVEYAIPSIPQRVKKHIKRQGRFMLDMERELMKRNQVSKQGNS